jgi:fermentation-respiration switch protein FrsA (DUF1100 family)
MRAVHLVLTTAALLAALFVALVVLVWWRQERIVFQPPRDAPADHDTLRVAYQASDGQPLFAYLVVPRGERTRPERVLIAFHGNADLAVWQVPWAAEVARRTGWAVLCPEYRGYAGLPGEPTYERSKLDARAAYAYARDSLDVPPAHVAIFGHSLGSAIAAALAAEERPSALLLQSPFTSARAMARIVVARPVAALWRVISRVHYDTEAQVRALDVPVHVAHGDRDFVIPVHMGRAVHAAARRRGRLFIARGAGHNDVGAAGEEYWSWIVEALRS